VTKELLLLATTLDELTTEDEDTATELELWSAEELLLIGVSLDDEPTVASLEEETAGMSEELLDSTILLLEDELLPASEELLSVTLDELLSSGGSSIGGKSEQDKIKANNKIVAGSKTRGNIFVFITWNIEKYLFALLQ